MTDANPKTCKDCVKAHHRQGNRRDGPIKSALYCHVTKTYVSPMAEICALFIAMRPQPAAERLSK